MNAIENLVFSTSQGPVSFNVYDISGYGYPRDEYYPGADGAVIVFDGTSRITYKNVRQWYHDILRLCGDIPVVLCGNKSDLKRIWTVLDHEITYPQKKGMDYYEISVKSKENIDKPFLSLARELLNSPSLEFISAPLLASADILANQPGSSLV